MQKTEIAREILAYLVDHPDAQDTLEGIIQWWLLERKIKYQTDMVKQTIAELVEKGFILEERAKDSRVHYRTNQSKQEEIRMLLQRERE